VFDVAQDAVRGLAERVPPAESVADLVKANPTDNAPRPLRIGDQMVVVLASRIRELALGPDDLLFGRPLHCGQTPMSRTTCPTRGWALATTAAELAGVRIHALCHARASWLVAGGADLKTVMDRLGHSQIPTTQNYLHANTREALWRGTLRPRPGQNVCVLGRPGSRVVARP
jgi:integrase